jgi:general secretion pathway protein K
MRTVSRGAALLLVLWLLFLLTGLISVFALTARTEGMQGRFLQRSVSARYAAETGIELAVVRVKSQDEAMRWIPDGRAYRFVFEDQQIEVHIIDESGKVDLNAADPSLLINLLLALGADEQKTREIVGALIDWRDPDDLLQPEDGAEDPQYAAAGLPYGAKDRPFETISELRRILGMDPALYRRLLPQVTVYNGAARPDPVYASEPVLKALALPEARMIQILAQRAKSPDQPALPGEPPLAGPGTGTYSISSRAVRGDGTRAEINATVRADANGFGRLYVPLSWRVGESD